MSNYPPSEYHARLKWEQEKKGKVIITIGQPYPPSEYHEREKLEKYYRDKSHKITHDGRNYKRRRLPY